MKNHLAIRHNFVTLCGVNYENKQLPFRRTFWADAVKVIKANPDYKGVNFCSNCLRILKTKRIRQLTAQECKES